MELSSRPKRSEWRDLLFPADSEVQIELLERIPGGVNEFFGIGGR